MKEPGTGPCGLFQLELPFLSKFVIFLFLSLADCYVTTTKAKMAIKVKQIINFEHSLDCVHIENSNIIMIMSYWHVFNMFGLVSNDFECISLLDCYVTETNEIILCYVPETTEKQLLVLKRNMGIYLNHVELYYFEPSGLGPDNFASIVSLLAGRRPFFRARGGRSGVQSCTRQAICLRSGTGHSCRDALFPLRACLFWSSKYLNRTLSNYHCENTYFIIFHEQLYRSIPTCGRLQWRHLNNSSTVETSLATKVQVECNLEVLLEFFRGNQSLTNNYND
jgi:hypothetical protein